MGTSSKEPDSHSLLEQSSRRSFHGGRLEISVASSAKLKNLKMLTGEMALWLGAAVSLRGPRVDPTSGSQLSVTIVLGDPVPSAGLRGHCIHTHRQNTHIQLIKIKLKSF